jgi:hypothetical protein
MITQAALNAGNRRLPRLRQSAPHATIDMFRETTDIEWSRTAEWIA